MSVPNDTSMSAYRIECDALGERRIEIYALYGIHTLRAVENFPLSGKHMSQKLVRALAEVKLACCRTNAALGYLEAEVARAIELACREVINGEHLQWFVVDALQGGAGTSANMNANEVIANRAAQIMGLPIGKEHVSPIEHVNLHQSTNDVFPTAVKLAVLHELMALEKPVADLQAVLQQKEQDFADYLRLGRTQLQDAVPVTFGMTFGAWAEAVARDRWRVFKCRERIRQVNLGGTAVGTGLGAPREFIFRAVDELRRVAGVKLSRADNLVDATQNTDAFAEVSGMLKTCAANLLKISTDLRLLGSGPHGGLGELQLPALQAGSSIMPAKVNPVVPEAVSQAAMRVMANDSLVSQAVSMGTLELNQFMPLIADAMLESLSLLCSAVSMLLNKCIRDIVVHGDHAQQLLHGSKALAAVLVPAIGYRAVQQAMREAEKSGISLAAVVAKQCDVAEDDVQSLLSPQRMRQLGYTDESYLVFKNGKQN